MKINEYNQMMSYLTRPGKVLANNINNKKISNTERTGLAKGTKADTKPAPKKSKMEQYINDHLIVYEDKKASPEETKAALKRLEAAPKKMSKTDEYNTYFNKNHPKYYNKKVAEKPKSNGKYTMPTINLDSFDWDLYLREHDKNYETLEEENKKAGLLEYELADEYWQEQYEQYLNQGGSLNFQQFMNWQNSMKVKHEINKRVKDKLRTEGIVEILSLNAGRKI